MTHKASSLSKTAFSTAMKTPSWTSSIRARRSSPGGSIITRAPFSRRRTPRHFRHDHSGKKFYDPTYKSCTKFLATIATEKFGFDARPIAELIKWGDIIDGAQFASPEEAVGLAEPAMQLALVIEAAPEANLVPRLIPELARFRSMKWSNCPS